ncbi:superoxide dismutase family protein [Maricaulis sp. CAU 1757]
MAPAVMETVRAELVGTDEAVSGLATFTQGPQGVMVRVQLRDLPVDQRAAWHGLHLHETGDCSASDFTSAGSHINPDGRAHGLLNADGPDNADLPNAWADASGNINVEIFTPRVSLNGENGKPALLDSDGSAIVIHAGPDDQVSQPIGGAGARIACGVIAVVAD